MADNDLTKLREKELYRRLGQYGEGRPERREVEAEIKRRETSGTRKRANVAIGLSLLSLLVALLALYLKN
jgi:hypothetical protein